MNDGGGREVAPSGYVSGIFFMKDVFGKSIFDLVIVFVYLFQTSS